MARRLGQRFRRVTPGLFAGIKTCILGRDTFREFLGDRQFLAAVLRLGQQAFHFLLRLFPLRDKHRAEQGAADQVSYADVDLPIARSHLDPHETEAVLCQRQRHDHGRVPMVFGCFAARHQLTGANGGLLAGNIELCILVLEQ